MAIAKYDIASLLNPWRLQCGFAQVHGCIEFRSLDSSFVRLRFFRTGESGLAQIELVDLVLSSDACALIRTSDT
jgi:hypothetical protein